MERPNFDNEQGPSPGACVHEPPGGAVPGGPLLVAVVGIDGSGKSTIVRRLCAERDGWMGAHWLQMFGPGNLTLATRDTPANLVHQMSPLARALFVGAINVWHYEEHIAPHLARGTSVVVDGYFYKFAAKERLYGRSDPVVFSVLRSMPDPDFVLFIDAPPELAYQRTQPVTSYEVRHSASPSDFVSFQRDVRRELLSMVAPLPHVVLDGSAAQDDVWDGARQAVDAFVRLRATDVPRQHRTYRCGGDGLPLR